MSFTVARLASIYLESQQQLANLVNEFHFPATFKIFA